MKSTDQIEEDLSSEVQNVRSVKGKKHAPSSTHEFPLANKSSTTEGVLSWTSVLIEKEQPGEELNDQPKNYVSLKTVTHIYKGNDLRGWILNLPFNVYWQVIVCVSILVNYFCASYAYSFERIIKNKINNSLFATLLVTDIIYLLDFLIALILIFCKSVQQNIKVKKRSKLAMVVDVTSLIPVDHIVHFSTTKLLSPLTMFLIHIPAYLRLYRFFYYCYEWGSAIDCQTWQSFIFRVGAQTSVLIHAAVCIWFLLGCFDECPNNKTWTLHLDSYELHMDKSSVNFWYFLSMYVSVSTLTNNGFGDFQSIRQIEYITSIILMMLGFIVTTAFYCAYVMSLKINSDQRRGSFDYLVHAIKVHLVNIKFEPQRLNLILKYYQILWVHRKGVTEAHDFNILPVSLQMEVCFDISVQALDNSLLFQKRGEPFLRKLSLFMKNTFHLPGEIIFHQNVVKNKMICVMSGVIEILSDEDDESPIIYFTSGTVLGEISLAMTVNAKATVRAATYTELLVLHRADFNKIIFVFPDILRRIKKDVHSRVRVASRQNVSEEKSEVLMNIYISSTQVKNPIKILKEKLRGEKSGESSSLVSKKDDKFNTSYMNLYKISKNTLFEWEKEEENTEPICYSSTFPWILYPGSQLIKLWDSMVFVVVVVICFICPQFAAFRRKFPNWSNVMLIAFDIVYLMDIIVRCTTAIEKSNVLICKFKDICSEQLNKKSFYLDVFALFPFEVISVMFTDKDQGERLYSVLKLNRLLKAWKIPAYFSKLKQNLWLQVHVLEAVKCVLYILIFCNWVASVLYMEACFYDLCIENSWFTSKEDDEIGQFYNNPSYEHPSIMSLYFASTIIFSTGIGDILPENMMDIIFIIIFMLLGHCTFWWLIASFSATIIHKENSKAMYRGIVNATNKFMKGNRMSKAIQLRINNYFQLQWEYNRGARLLRSENLLIDVPNHLQREVLIKERVETLCAVPLFMYVDRDLLQLIAINCCTMLLPSNEIITHAGGMNREMYIVQEGFCESIISSGKLTTTRVLGPKEFFGDLEMLYEIPRYATVRSLTHCKVLTIEYGVYEQVISMFPSVMEINEEVMEEFRKDVMLLNKNNSNYVPPISEFKQRRRSLDVAYRNFSHKFKTSFIYIPSYCKMSGEDYSAPFKSLQKLYFVKYLLLPWCISPHGKLLRYWYFFRIIIAFCLALFEPYRESISHEHFHHSAFLMFVDAIAFIDLYLMLHVGYYNEKGILVTHPKCTSKYYITHNFLVDLLACIPFNVFLYRKNPTAVIREEKDDYIEIICTLLRVNRILQIYRLSIAVNASEKDILNEYTTIRFLKYIPFTIIIINIWACVMITLNCHLLLLNETGLMHRNEKHPHTRFSITSNNMTCKLGSWLTGSHFENVTDSLELYMVVFYWITSSFVGTGLGDIIVDDVIEMLLITVIIICGGLMFGYMFANIASTRMAVQDMLSVYREMLLELIDFMESEMVNEQLQKRFVNHMEYQWKRRGGIQPYQIFTKLHTSLMQDAMLEMYLKTLKEMPLFESLQLPFLRIIATCLQEEYFLRGEIIVRSQDVQNNIYIIFRGKVEILSEYNEMLACMGSGGMFGNISSINFTKCAVSIVASSNLDLLTVSSSTFYEVLNRYPKIRNKVEAHLLSAKDYIMPTTIVGSSESWDVTARTSSTQESVTYGSIITPSRKSGSSGITGGTVVSRLSIVFLGKWYKFVILPESVIYTVLSHIILFTTYVSCLLVTYLFAFQDDNMSFIITSLSLDAIFYFKIFLEFNQTFLDRYGEYVLDKKKICSHYFANKFEVFLDITSNFPFWLLCLAVPYGLKLKVLSILRLFTLLRFLYIIDFYKTQSNLLTVNRLFLKAVINFVCTTFFIHVCACFWYLIACPLSNCKDYSWAYYMGIRNTTLHDSYILSLYYVVSLISGTGYGDIVAHNIIETTFSSILMIISKFLVAAFIMYVTSMLRAHKFSLNGYIYQVQELLDFLRNQNISIHQTEKVWKYVHQLWQHRKGKQMPRLILEAPSVMRCDLMNALYGHHFRQCYIFAGIGEDFIRQLAVKLMHYTFFEDNYIVQHGDTDQNMYFIQRGEVSILTVHANLTETIHDVLKKDDMFGIAQGLSLDVPHHFSFRAKTQVNILSLNLQSWSHLLNCFPEVKDIIYSRASNMYLNV